MATFIYIAAAMMAAASAAPPAPPRYYQGGPGNPNFQGGLEQYYLDTQDVANYYNQAQQKQGQGNVNAPARLENLEPDSEVELVQGVQPQQPPQQNPVSPNLPGLVPGQRVFIVHMPVAGYRPGTVGGYQPLYIVAASPQGSPGAPGYTANGYQNAILLDPSGQGVASPVNGYYRPGLGPQQGNPGLFLGAPLGLQRPFGLGYQDPNFGYQQVGPQGPGPEGQQLRLTPLPQRQQAGPGQNAAPSANQAVAPSEQKRVGQSTESNELKEEPRRNVRPPQAQASRKP